MDMLRNGKFTAIKLLILAGVVLFSLIVLTDYASAEDAEESSEPVVARAIEVESGPGYIGAIEGETYVPYGLRVNVTRGNSTIGYTKSMGWSVFKNGELQEGFSYTQGEAADGRMRITVYYEEGGNKVSDSFEVDVIEASAIPMQAEDGYYEIGTADELAAFSFMVSAVGMTDINGRLTADIDAAGTDYQPIGQYYTDSRKSQNTADIIQDRIGGSYFPGYSGIFDGNGKTVNLDMTARRGAGLLAITKGATVKDVTVTGRITAQYAGAYPAVGAGIVAIAYDTEETGKTVVENCVNEAAIESEASAGGIIGSGTTAAGCRNEGDITVYLGIYNYGHNSGGIVGSGTAIDCVNHGNIYVKLSEDGATETWPNNYKYFMAYIGGIVGSGTADNCLNTGNVQQETTVNASSGGIAGVIDITSADVTRDCVNTGDVTGPYAVGGITGVLSCNGDVISNCYNYGTISCNDIYNPRGYGGAAGIAGRQEEELTEVKISDCCNLGQIVHPNYRTGAIVGYTGKLPANYPNQDTAFVMENCRYIASTADASTGVYDTAKNLTDNTEALSKKDMVEFIRNKADLPYEDVQLNALESVELALMEDQKAADDVMAKIEALETVTLESEAAVKAAKEAYDALTDEQKQLVTNIDRLTAAAEMLDKLKEEKAEADREKAEADKKAAETEAAVKAWAKVSPAKITAASAAYNKIKVTWSSVSGAEGYQIYRATSKTGTFKLIKTVSSGTGSLVNINLTTGTTYYYKVIAYKTIDGNRVYSGFSAIKSAKPTLSAPGTPAIGKSSSKYVKVKWKGISGETGYQVYRATSRTGRYTKVASVKMTGSSYPYARIKAAKGKTYYYKVRAYKKVGSRTVCSAFSAAKAYRLK